MLCFKFQHQIQVVKYELTANFHFYEQLKKIKQACTNNRDTY